MAGARNLGTLSIDLIAKVGGFTQGLDKAGRSADKTARGVERRMRQMGESMGRAFKVAGALAVASFGAIGAGVKSAIDAADALGKMSQRTGISVEALSRLEVAASQSDVSLETLQKGVINLGRAQLEARKGTEDQVALFKALGIQLDELERLSPDELLKRIADAFQATADSPEKAAVAMKLFGRAGADLIPMLNGGSAELKRFDKLSDDLGNTLSEEAALAAAEFNDQLDLVRIGINGVWRETATGLLPKLNELAGDLNDPQFREGFSSIVAGAVEATATVAGLIAELGNLTRWAGEEVAARINGPSRDDIVRLEQLRDRIQEELDSIIIDVPAIFSTVGTGRRDELKAQLREAEAQIAEFYRNVGQIRDDAKPEARPEAEGAGGIDLDAWKKAMQEREAASAAAAAARKAGADAAREQAEADRQMAQALREAADASTAFLTTSEDLRALLGGPLAQVQLEYTRREDELVRLAQLAGLSNEELAASLDLLEAARLRDVAAIEEQIKQQKALEQALKDQPYVDQMDQLRDTTAGFFADLVKNGKDAIDRLQDYLLTSALESIGRQIAEGLFGDFGTKGNAGKGGFLDGLLGFLGFGGPRADGGPVVPGKSYLVGEEGPELFRPMGAGVVVPAEETAAMGRGISIGGDTIIIQGATSNRSLERVRVEKQRRMARAVREFS